MDSMPLIDVPNSIAEVIAALEDAGYETRLVGGTVRDALMGKSPADWDGVTTAEPEMVRLIVESLPSVRTPYPLGERFGTVGIALEDGTTFEISKVRASSDVVDFERRLSVDLALRDFTMNAMAYDVARNQLTDPHDGARDIEAKLIRACGDPDARFSEDSIRTLRAARFAAMLGFDVEEATRTAMRRHTPDLAQVAAERIRDELNKLLTGEHVGQGLQLMLESGVLAIVLPEVAALDGLTQPPLYHNLDALPHTFAAVEHVAPSRLLRWACLLHDTGKALTRSVDETGRIRFLGHARESAVIARTVCERLRFSKDDTAVVAHLVAEHMRLGQLDLSDERAIDRAVRKIDLRKGPRTLASAEDAVALALADAMASAHSEEAPSWGQALSEAVAASRARTGAAPPAPLITATDLMRELHMGPGPEVGRALRAIAVAAEKGEIEPTDRASALAIAKAAVLAE